MENSSSTSSNPSTTTSSIPNSLRLLNKSSHKISKPFSSKPFIPINTPPLTPSTTTTSTTSTTSTTDTTTTTINTTSNTNTNPQGQQPQPPVYNINKNDFREVVQKLTGSPAFHHTAPTPAMISSPSPPTVLSPPPPPPAPPLQGPTISRLHRIRPPPLAELAPRPPPPFAAVRPPMSPLPPLPTVSAAVESPITAYMRRLRGEPPPASPLAFGCFPSPGTLAALSPTRLFPTSPGPVPSPRWREL